MESLLSSRAASFVPIIFFLAFISACSTDSKVVKTLPDTHTSQNSLDWSGYYMGILPCADCEGIRTVVYLDDAVHYRMRMSYLGEGKDNSKLTDGSFLWDSNGMIITLDSGEHFKVEENRLRRLNPEKEMVQGVLAEFYLLEKINGRVEDVYWELASLDEKEIQVSDSLNKRPYFILDKEYNRVSGNAGCNHIMGSYQILENQKISFSRMASTMMACPDMELEQLVFKMFEQADQYQINGNELILEQSGRILARFKANYLR